MFNINLSNFPQKTENLEATRNYKQKQDSLLYSAYISFKYVNKQEILRK